MLLVSSLILSFLFIFGCEESSNQEVTRYDNLSHEIDTNLATPMNPVISPSGKFTLVIDKGYDGQVHYNPFKVLSRDKGKEEQIVFQSAEQYRTRDALFFIWDNEDRVWVYSEITM